MRVDNRTVLEKNLATETRAPPPSLALFALAPAVAFLVLVGPVLVPSVQLAGRDTSRLYYPVKLAIASALGHGRLLLWDPWTESGVSLLGQLTPGLLHPFTLLYAALPFDLAFKLNHLLALPLAGLGAALLARRLGASGAAALIAAVSYGGCGALLSAASSNLPFALGPAGIPLAIAALLWLLESPSPRRLLGAAAALALCAYAGDPQSMLVAALGGCALAWQRLRSRRVWLTFAWAAAALVLALPVALPAAAQLARSSREAGAASDLERGAFSTPPLRLLGLAVPFAFDGAEDERGRDTFSEYLGRGASPFYDSLSFGLPALLFACAALGSGAGRTLFALAAVLLAASTGEAMFVQGLLLRAVPLWRYFRYAEKLITPACCFLSVAAALGAERALGLAVRGEGGASRRRLLWASAGLSLFALAAWALLALGERSIAGALVAAGQQHDPELAQRFATALSNGALACAGLSGLVALVCAARARTSRPALVLASAAAICFASTMLTAPRALHAIPVEAYRGDSLSGAGMIARAGPSSARWRAYSTPGERLFTPIGIDPRLARTLAAREALWPQLSQLDGIETAASYFSAPDRSYEDAERRAEPALQELFGVRFHVLAPGAASSARAHVRLSETGFPVLESAPQPRAFLLGAWHPVADSAAAIDALASPSFEPHALAVIPEGRTRQDAARAAVAVELSRRSPEQLELQPAPAARSLLVVAEHYDPGWSASLDGAPAEVVAVDALALGVEVPAGAHNVSLRFRPSGFLPGLAAALALVAVLLALPRRPVLA